MTQIELILYELEKMYTNGTPVINGADYQHGFDYFFFKIRDFVKKIPTKPLKIKYAGKVYDVLIIEKLPGDVLMYGIEDEPGHIDYIGEDSCELVLEQPSEDLEKTIIEYLSHVPENEPESSNTLYTYEQMQDTARHFAHWQKERLIKKACQWLHDRVDVDDEVKMINGEPEASSWVAKNLHRIEVADKLVAEFRKAMFNQDT